MDKNGILFTILVIIVVVFAGSTTFLVLDKKDSGSKSNENLTKTILSSGESSANKEMPEATGQYPSNPMIVYEVAQGDTLNPIGLKYDINWTYIALFNDLKEPYTILKGRKLFIPQKDEVTGNVRVIFGLDKTKAQEFQDKIKTSRSGWIDSATVAQVSHAGVGGLNSEKTSFRLISMDETSGKAHVTGAIEDKSFDIFLTQPLGIGKDKIWVINYIGELR